MSGSTAIQKRASRILHMPLPDKKVEDIAKRLDSMALYIAQKDLENEAWRTKMEDLFLNRSLRASEAAEILKLSVDAVRKAIQSSNLGGGKDGGRWKTTYRDVLNYMNARPKKFGQNMTITDVIKAK